MFRVGFTSVASLAARTEHCQSYVKNIQPEDLAKFEIIIGNCSCQAIVENLAMLIGIRMWLPV